ncbi:MAG: MATE family efflux transporter [Lysobacterales bacterium]|jgi:putative MATE family efflux protein
MQDLTEGPVAGHLVRMAIPIAVGMVFQTLYFLVDIYFVAQLGDAAIAGLSASGNVMYLVMALTQILGVGTMALISHAAGRKDRDDANLVFNQSVGMAALCGLFTLVAGYTLGGFYLVALVADAATLKEGLTYLHWFLPGLGLQFALVSTGAALRGTGIVKPTIVVQILSVGLNVLLAPMLIRGWPVGYAMGVAGAGLATSISVAFGVALMLWYYIRLERYVMFDLTLLAPRAVVWKRIMAIGLPPGGEFALMFVYLAIIYWVLQDLGPEAQAGFGVGSRVMQAIFLPAMAVAFACAPVAGQNFGAGKFDRVRATFRVSAGILSVLMLILTLLCRWRPEALIAFFSQEPEVIAFGAGFLRIISLNFVATGIVFTCAGVFQALGNTLPSLVASGTRIVTFAIPAVWLAGQPWFEARHLWYTSVLTIFLQAAMAWWLLHRRMARLPVGEPAAA